MFEVWFVATNPMFKTGRRRCLEKGCGRDAAGSFLCDVHAHEAYLAYADWERLEKLEARRQLHSRPRRPSDVDDDWRSGMLARSRLRRPCQLFPSEGLTWKRMPRIEKTGTWAEPDIALNEHGLWPSEYVLALVELKEEIERRLKTLTLREEVVVRMRFGIPGFVERGGEHVAIDVSSELDLDEIGDLFHKSRERIRQIETEALRKLRNPQNRHALRPHYGEQGRFFRREEDDEAPKENDEPVEAKVM